MKINFKLFIIFYCFYFVSPNSTIPATLSIISELYLVPKIPFDVIIYNTSSSKVFDIVDGIGSRLNGKILKVSKPSKWNYELKQSAIIFTDNKKDVQALLYRIQLRNSVAKLLKFLFYTREEIDLEKLFIIKPTFDRGYVGHFSYFIIDTSKELQLKTVEWFTEKACHAQQEVLINSFKNESWNKTLEIPQKFRNFHNCTMDTTSRIFDYRKLELFLLIRVFFTEKINKMANGLTNFEKKIADTIAERGNFTYNFVRNGWDSRSMQTLHIFYMSRSPILNDDCQVGSIFSQDFETFLTSIPEPYGSYEKMMLPFDIYTWINLFGVIFSAFVVVLVVNGMSREIQTIFYGESVRDPSINILRIIFGFGQEKEPRTAFARVLLLTFVLFCFVMRTGYQGY